MCRPEGMLHSILLTYRVSACTNYALVHFYSLSLDMFLLFIYASNFMTNAGGGELRAGKAENGLCAIGN